MSTLSCLMSITAERDEYNLFGSIAAERDEYLICLMSITAERDEYIKDATVISRTMLG